jgi:ABC-type dipeptide/oligopeptide/nickel transport system permease component
MALIPTLLGVLFAAFLMLHLIPGDPARVAAGPDASDEDITMIRERYGLDKPLWEQFAIYLGRVAQGDLGESVRTRRPVVQEIARRLPATVELAAGGMLLAVLLGVPLGVAASLRPNTVVDNLITGASVLGISMPSFFLGLILMIVFSARLGFLPPTGRGGLEHLLMPSVTLGLAYVATFARLTRSNMLDVLSEDYIRTARAKGLQRRRVIWWHALVNAAIPLLTLLGVYFGRLLGGAVIIESVFAWPGLGRYMVNGIVTRDFDVVQASILVFATAIVLVNLAVDLLYGIVDPRLSRG